jgi:hypothetical protein
MMHAVQRRRDSLEYLRGAAMFCLAAAGLLWLAVNYKVGWNVLVLLHYNDFGKFYYAVVQARQGGSLYSPTVATLIPLSTTVSRQFLDLNPPHFHLLIWPLSYLSLRNAYFVWTAINACLALAALAAIRAELSLRLSTRRWFLLVLALLATAPTLAWFVTGQLSGILAALATWIWVEFRRERWARAGWAVGIACSLKLFLGPLLVYLILRSRWRAVVFAVVAMCLCFTAGVLVFGAASHREWLAALHGVSWTWAAMNASIAAPFARITVPNPRMADRAEAGFALTAAATVASLVILSIGVWSSIRTRSMDRAVCVLYLTALLSSPLGWIYYHWILAGPGFATFRHDDRRIVAAVCAGLFVPFFLLSFSSVLLAVTAGSLYMWSTLLLWILAVAHTNRDRVG